MSETRCMSRPFLSVILFCLAGGLMPAQEKRPVTNTRPSPSPRNSLEDLSDTVERLVRQVSPAVLQIVSEGFVGHDAERGAANTVSRETGVGTGFFVSSDGDLITNAHVVTGARRVRGRLHDAGTG